MRSLSRAFTLIEMLVVVSTIVLLIALLLPALRSARRAAYDVTCVANLHQHGVAIHGYLRDHIDTFPLTLSWADLSGKAGDPAMNASNLYSANTIPYDSRPLNKYLGDAQASRCPADLGDSYNDPAFIPIRNCFIAYGNSYQAPFSYDVLRTKKVFGQINAGGAVLSKPARYSAFKASFSNKLVQGDYVWWGNRPIGNPKSRWHSAGTERRYCILYADWHAALTTFPLDQEAFWPASDPPPDPNNLWW